MSKVLLAAGHGKTPAGGWDPGATWGPVQEHSLNEKVLWAAHDHFMHVGFTGFEVELASMLAQRMGRQARPVHGPWDRLLELLARGDFDVALNGIEVADEKRRLVALSRPYFAAAEVLTIRKGDASTPRSLENVKGRKVGTLPGSMAARILERGHARFLGLTQQALLHFLAGGNVVGRPLGGRRLGRRSRRLGRRHRSLNLRLGRCGRLSGLAQDAPLLDLDNDGVRAAMAEALLHLAGLDRALQAQRRPGTKLGLVALVGHAFPSSTNTLAAPGRAADDATRASLAS